MRRLTWVAGLLGILGLGAVGVARAADPCRAACHTGKSTAYRRCRAIPPADRAARAACFKQADQQLARCLAGCK